MRIRGRQVGLLDIRESQTCASTFDHGAIILIQCVSSIGIVISSLNATPREAPVLVECRVLVGKIKESMNLLCRRNGIDRHGMDHQVSQSPPINVPLSIHKLK